MSSYDTEEKRAKHAARQRAWRAANPERWKSIARPARDKWRAKNYVLDCEINRTLRYNVRREVLDLVGG